MLKFNFINHLANSKWTSVQNLKGYRHYEVLNIFKNKGKVEMFCICERNIKIFVSIGDLKDENKWFNGWVDIEQVKTESVL